MRYIGKLKNFASKFFLLAILFITVIILCGVFTVKESDIIENAFAANSPTYSLTSSVRNSPQKANSTTNTETVNPSTVAYGSMNGKGTITADYSSGALDIEIPAANFWHETLYADLTAAINVPAWHIYTVTYKFDLSFRKTNADAANTAGYEIFDYNDSTSNSTHSTTTNGASVQPVFDTSDGTSTSSTTSPSTYTKKAAHYSQSNSTYTESYSVTFTLENRSNSSVSFSRNFGLLVYKRATTSNATRLVATLTPSHTVVDTKLSVAKPTADTRTFEYTGKELTYRPTLPPASESSLYKLSTSSAALTQTKVGTYTIIYELVNPAVNVWEDGTTDPVELTFAISKGTPDIGISYTGQGSSRYLNLGIPKTEDITFTGTNSGLKGTFAWDAGQPVVAGTNSYTWAFTPEDLDNWNIKYGSEDITFITAAPVGLSIEADSDIYDRFDKNTSATLDAYLKKHISVKIKYEDNSVSSAPLSSEDFVITNTEADFLIKSGSPDDETITEKRQINVKVTSSDPQLKGLTGSVEATVKKAVIKSVSVDPKSNATALKYPVTLDQIKANYEMSIVWNYFPRAIVAEDSLVGVVVKQTTDNPNGDIKAGSIDLTFTYTNGSLVKTVDFTGCSIAKGDIDTSGISFSDKSEQYDGQAKKLEITGSLPTGVKSVTYTSSGDNTSVGTHTITAHFVVDDNYNEITPDWTATLTITNSGWNMTGVTFTDDTLTFDGNFHIIEIGGAPLPDSRIQVTYKYEKGGVEVSAPNGVKDAGVYTVTASFSNPDPTNYADIPDMTATLTINKASYDMSGITFEDKTVPQTARNLP